MFNYGTCRYGDSLTAGRLICFCRISCNFLLFFKHASHFCSEGNFSIFPIFLFSCRRRFTNESNCYLYENNKVIEVIRHPQDKAEARFNTDTGISKEDEERYKKLVVENEELQKLIAQVRFFSVLFVLFVLCGLR
jgi:hypothetical protein